MQCNVQIAPSAKPMKNKTMAMMIAMTIKDFALVILTAEVASESEGAEDLAAKSRSDIKDKLATIAPKKTPIHRMPDAMNARAITTSDLNLWLCKIGPTTTNSMKKPGKAPTSGP